MTCKKTIFLHDCSHPLRFFYDYPLLLISFFILKFFQLDLIKSYKISNFTLD